MKASEPGVYPSESNHIADTAEYLIYTPCVNCFDKRLQFPRVEYTQ